MIYDLDRFIVSTSDDECDFRWVGVSAWLTRIVYSGFDLEQAGRYLLLPSGADFNSARSLLLFHFSTYIRLERESESFDDCGICVNYFLSSLSSSLFSLSVSD